VFVLVGIAGYRRRGDTGANTGITVLAVAASVVVLVFFVIDTLRNDPATFVAIIAIALLAVLFDFLWKRGRGTSVDGTAEAAQEFMT